MVCKRTSTERRGLSSSRRSARSHPLRQDRSLNVTAASLEHAAVTVSATWYRTQRRLSVSGRAELAELLRGESLGV